MIVGGYTINLYCDDPQHKEAFNHWSNPPEFSGNSKTECYKLAREAGWKIVRDKAYCPICRKAQTAIQAGEG